MKRNDYCLHLKEYKNRNMKLMRKVIVKLIFNVTINFRTIIEKTNETVRIH